MSQKNRRPRAVAGRRRQYSLSLEWLEWRQLLSQGNPVIVVTSASDNTDGSGVTLRDAIEQVNSDPNGDVPEISFSIGSGQQTITLNTALPQIKHPVTIDGLSSTGTGPPLITLTPATINGAAAFSGDGLDIDAGDSTVAGLIIRGFNGNGVVLAANGRDQVLDSYIGTNDGGSAASPNTGDGVVVSGSNSNTISGNVLSGNGGDGVLVANNNQSLFFQGTDTTNATIDATVDPGETMSFGSGLNPFTLSGQGYALQSDATVAGTVNLTFSPSPMGSGNYIVTGTYTLDSFYPTLQGNGASSTVTISSQSVAITGTVSGNQLNATFALKLAGTGVGTGSEFDYLGLLTGTVSTASNGDITFQQDSGVPDGRVDFLATGITGVLNVAGSDTITGNDIGTNSAGSAAVPNGGNGVDIQGSGGDVIGTEAPGASNLISGNALNGIVLGWVSSSNFVVDNKIGTNAADTAGIPNGESGVFITDSSSSNVIGPDNIVADNRSYGIGADTTGSANTFTENSIFGNSAGGISLSPSTNNGLQPPTLTASTSYPGQTVIQGSLKGVADDDYTLELYTNSATNPQAKTLFQTETVSGDSPFSFTYPDTVAPGTILTAIVTDFTSSSTDSLRTSSQYYGDSSAISNALPVSSAFVVTNTNDSGIGSLRQVLTNANNHLGLDTITFDIPGPGVHTITPATPLPAITDSVVIDGYSQPGASPNSLVVGDNAVPLIQIDGSLLGPGATNDGLEVKTNNSVISGLWINNFGGAGIQVDGTGNTIGGTAAGAGNLISGNTTAGILITGTQGQNDIQGNVIGLDKAGNLASNSIGISISNSAGNTIGGTSSATIAGTAVPMTPNNVISGNTQEGILISGSNSTKNLVGGNDIGTNVAGTGFPSGSTESETSPGQAEGVVINDGASNNTIGGAAAGNVISGNHTGVEVDGQAAASGVFSGGAESILDNLIGTDKTGTIAVPNIEFGVLINSSPRNTIGPNNVLSANGIAGVELWNAGSIQNSVIGNTLGTDINGKLAFAPTAAGQAATTEGIPVWLGAQLNGVVILGALNNTIGATTTTPGDGNIIGGNQWVGAYVTSRDFNENVYSVPSGNWISGNTFDDNLHYGILFYDAPNNLAPPLEGKNAGVVNDTFINSASPFYNYDNSVDTTTTPLTGKGKHSHANSRNTKHTSNTDPKKQKAVTQKPVRPRVPALFAASSGHRVVHADRSKAGKHSG